MNEWILQQSGFYSLSGSSFWGDMLSENHSALRKDLVQGLSLDKWSDLPLVFISGKLLYPGSWNLYGMFFITQTLLVTVFTSFSLKTRKPFILTTFSFLYKVKSLCGYILLSNMVPFDFYIPGDHAVPTKYPTLLILAQLGNHVLKFFCVVRFDSEMWYYSMSNKVRKTCFLS